MTADVIVLAEWRRERCGRVSVSVDPFALWWAWAGFWFSMPAALAGAHKGK